MYSTFIFLAGLHPAEDRPRLIFRTPLGQLLTHGIPNSPIELSMGVDAKDLNDLNVISRKISSCELGRN